MNLCPFCKEEIREGAILCKHCKSDLAQAPVNPDEKKEGMSGFQGCLTIIIILLVLAVGVKMCPGSFSRAAPKPVKAQTAPKKAVAPDYRIEAWVFTEMKVEQALDSPDVTFCDYSRKRVQDLGDGKYFVISYADVGNILGGKQRNHFEATVQRLPSGDWKVLNIEAK